MKKLKEIEKMFPDSHRTENGQILVIKACYVGDNFYDYGEEGALTTFYELEENNIDYLKCKSLQELIYTIEQYMNDENYDVLNNLLDVLQERNYYQNYK